MTGTCATCGNPMPYRRKDGTILKREFCSRIVFAWPERENHYQR